jgi:hypothetical protein
MHDRMLTKSKVGNRFRADYIIQALDQHKKRCDSLTGQQSVEKEVVLISNIEASGMIFNRSFGRRAVLAATRSRTSPWKGV